MSALDKALNCVLNNNVLSQSYGGIFRQAAAELAQLRAEIDRYDKVCTAVRNELNNAGIPELTDDKLSVRSLVARVALLRAQLADMRKALQGLVDHFADEYADYPRTIPELRAAIAVLAEYPAVKK